MTIQAADEERRELLKAQLISMIENHSESYYAAGWSSGIEDDLWAAGGVWHILGDAIGEWPIRNKSTNYAIEWRPLPERAS